MEYRAPGRRDRVRYVGGMRQPAGTGPQEPRRAPALAKRFLVGRMLAATRRLARAFPRGARAQVAERRDRRTGRVPPPTARRREVRSVVCVPVGPGRQIALADTLESLLASDGDASQIVVIDDWCNDCGNCETFCPDNGAPNRVKPRLTLAALEDH